MRKFIIAVTVLLIIPVYSALAASVYDNETATSHIIEDAAAIQSAEVEVSSDVPVPTNVSWAVHDGMPGFMSFKAVPESEGEYEIVVYLDGKNYGDIYYTGCFPEDGDDTIYINYCDYIFDSGSYTFTVATVEGNGQISAPSKKSAPYNYVRPKVSLPAPTNLRWDDVYTTCARWDDIPDNDHLFGYRVNIYGKYADSNRYMDLGSRSAFNQLDEAGFPVCDFLDWMDDDSMLYKFSIYSISKNIEEVANSYKSEFSDIFFSDVKVRDIYSRIKELDTSGADEIKDTLSDLNLSDLAMSMQTNGMVLDKVTALEEQYAGEKDIYVNVDCDEYSSRRLDMSAISVVGAAFNAADGATDVSLSFKQPDEEIVVDESQYENVIQFNISLDGAAPGRDLTVPIRITMPIPYGVSYSKLQILHHHADGTYETIWPLDIDKYENTVSFTVTSFSDFTFADKVTPADVEVYSDELYAEDAIAGTISLYIQSCYSIPDAKLYVAAYDRSGGLAGVQSFSLDLSEEGEDFDLDVFIECGDPYEVRSVKAFLWDGSGEPLFPVINLKYYK